MSEIIYALQGIFLRQNLNLVLTISISILLILGFKGAPLLLWMGFAWILAVGFAAPPAVLVALGVFTLVGCIRPLRAMIITQPVLLVLKKLQFLPKISETELAAIEAGAVWMEGELFSGKPDLQKMIEQPYPQLSAEEQAFLDGPVNRLCAMIDSWKIWKERRLPDEVWNFIRKEKFLGMIIPKKYGGLEFSATAHSEVIRRVSSRNGTVATYIMVPNSLGPAELLIHYGTEQQKKHYLPRLANGEEIPCFALTEPLAGSDAGSLTSDGVLFKGADGQLQIRLNWNKRWITLASISTVLGLAFRLRDPENFLGRGSDLGITCALIPSHSPGIALGKRHDPLHTPFHNCPTQGKDVIVPASAIVGGVENAGQGWRMLMESLAAGRGISFPAQGVGNTQLVTRVVTAHALIRQQFGVSIGHFEGVQEAISKIIGFNYILESLRNYTLSALEQGIKPAVVTAIAKHYSTELGRLVINLGMDVMGGAGISLGPKNLLGQIYMSAPIAITVEGANILTRSLIIFGQGALRAHPYAYLEVKAYEANDLRGFDRAFWGHIGHIVRNSFRSVLLSVSRGWLSFPWPRGGSTGVYYRKLAWSSASFAILSDIAMGSLGGKLKMKESLSGRFADILAYMYMGTAVLRRFEAEGAKREELPFVHFSMGFIFGRIQRAFDGIFGNLEVPGLTWFFKGPLRSWSNFASLGGDVADVHVRKIVELVLNNPEQREHLTRGMYMPNEKKEQLVVLDQALGAYRQAQLAQKKLKEAVKAKKLEKKPLAELISSGLKSGVITELEVESLKTWERLRVEAVQVDAFTEEEYHA